MKKLTVILPAAGKGSRLNLPYPKEILRVNKDKALIDNSFNLFHGLGRNDVEFIVVINEEKTEIIPAINEAKSLGINADGPLPCDTSFITSFKNKNHDCIVGMYHDGIQSGLKAFGFDRGITVQGGLPVPITTPAHGTAFDIAGKNIANLEPTLQSFKIVLKMVINKINE